MRQSVLDNKQGVAGVEFMPLRDLPYSHPESEELHLFGPSHSACLKFSLLLLLSPLSCEEAALIPRLTPYQQTIVMASGLESGAY